MKEEHEGPIGSLRVIHDPRMNRTKRHPWESILFTAICAVLCGAESWEDMEDFGNLRRPWLERFVEFPHGIPSHDTFGRVFAQIDSEAFQRIDWFADKEAWKGLQSIGMVESERTIGEQKSVERRYYLTSLKADAQEFARAVRGHWSIENQLHWSLDVSFNEDQCRVRVRRAAENFALLRRMTLHILKQDTASKKSLNRKRRQAAMDPAYLEVLLGKI